jgi:hypothetical protein
MRRTLLSILSAAALAVLTCPSLAQAQPASRRPSDDRGLHSGTTIVSGLASFSSQGGDLYEDSDGDGLTAISVVPSALYIVTAGLALGGDVSYTRQSQGDFSTTVFGVGPKVAYFVNTGGNAIPYMGVGWNYISLGASSGGEGDSESGSRIKGVVGVMIKSGHLGIVIEGGYLRDSFSVEFAGEEGESISGSSIAVGVGFAGLFY